MEHFFPRIQVKTKKKVFTKNGTKRVARNLQWRGANFWVWGRSLQQPKANGGPRARTPAARRRESEGFAPSRRRHGGLGAEPPALENFAFFAKIA